MCGEMPVWPVRLAAVSLLLIVAGCGGEKPPYGPEEAMGTFEVEEGFRVELFASEPHIADPVAMEFDEFGRIYVVENPGYPLDVDSANGKVKLLEDTGGDGRIDRSTVFAENLTMPTGVMAWKKGILVTDAPNVLYFEDTDGDGRADRREVVLTGFASTNPQHTVSSPLYGLDNWIYLSHEGAVRAVVFDEKFGDPGGEIHYPARPDGPRLPMERRSLRFRPDGFELELLAGPSQFGQTFNAWGDLFTHNNSDHVRHEVLAARYLERNPALRIARPWHDMSDHGNASEVYPVTMRPRYEILSGVGRITSASGLTLYAGGKFPAGYENVSFVGEPTHNLVHTDRWFEAGTTFRASRLAAGREFLASTDSWFRPVNFQVGPDGALYMVDYYRRVIEHPEWTSADTYASEDFLYQGRGMGRIYRIVPDGFTDSLRGSVAEGGLLGEASGEELVAALGSDNRWRRRTAQRLLAGQGTEAPVALLEKAAGGESALARLHALWTLRGLDRLDDALIFQSLGDPEAGVRRNALILAEPRLADHPEWIEELLSMAGETDPKVRFQLLCTLGEARAPKAVALRDKFLFSDIEDRWMQLAALSWRFRPGEAAALFRKAAGGRGLTKPGGNTEARAGFFERLASILAASGTPRDAAAVLSAVSRSRRTEDAWWRRASLEGLAAGLAGRGDSITAAGRRSLLVLFATSEADVRRAALGVLVVAGLDGGDSTVAEAVRRAAAIAADDGAEAEARADAIALLGLAGPKPHRVLLKSLIHPGQPQPVQREAVKAYGAIPGTETASFLLENWRTMAGPVRYEAAEALYRGEARILRVVEAMENGEIEPWMLSSKHRHRLIMHKDAGLRERARRLLTQPDAERQAVIEQYEAALELDADAARGKEIFLRVCEKCHLLSGKGGYVGPDLATVSGRPPTVLLADILMPNRSIAQTYESYVVDTKNGESFDGVIGEQGPAFLILRREEEEDVIQRKDIESMYATSLSAMPSNLEKEVSVAEMADLLRYLKLARDEEAPAQ